jgi:hypothetical protein
MKSVNLVFATMFLHILLHIWDILKHLTIFYNLMSCFTLVEIAQFC